MASYNNRQYTNYRGINLASGNGVIRFETPDQTPTTTSGERLLYVDSSNQLIFDSGSATTVIGAAGGAGATPTWETIFSFDSTFTISSGTTWTIAGNHADAVDVLTLTNIAGGSGDVIQITNSGTGKDINGTSGTWSVTKAGVGTYAGLSVSGTSSALATTGAAVWTIKDNDSASLSIDATGATGLLKFDTTNSAEVVSTAATSFLVSAGLLDVVQASNTVASLRVTNDTATTFGANADSSGVAVIRSTSLTTGSLLQLQLTEGTLNGGFYLTLRDVTAGANVFTLGEDGAVAITGAGGNAMLTVSAGDLVVSDGSLTMTDADNAASFSLTNNTATTASVVVVAGSGTFTGSTTTSFMTLTASGLTSGTVLYMPAAALTTGKIIHQVANAMTTGVLNTVSSTSAVLTSGGFASYTWNPTTYTGAGITTAGLVSIADSPTISTTVNGTHNDLNVTRTNTTSAAAITYTVTGSVVKIVNAAPTVGAGSTLADTAIVLDVQQNSTEATTGVALAVTSAAGAGGTQAMTVVANSVTTTTAGVVSITANALTTGAVLKLASSSTGMTSGSLLVASTATTGAVATNGIISIRATGAFTSASQVGLVDVLASAATGAATIMRVKSSAAAQTAVEVMRVEASGYTTGYAGQVMNVIGVATTGAAADTHSVLSVTGANTTGGNVLMLVNNALTTGVGLLFAHTTSVIANGGSLVRISSTSVDTSTTTGTLIDLSSTSATTGKLVLLTDTGLTTGVGVHLSHATSVIADGGSMLRISSTGVDTGGATNGVLLDLSSTASTAGTMVLHTFSGLTTGTGTSMVLGALTTGKAISITANALTTGNGLFITSSSADTGARGLIQLTSSSTSATGTSAIRVTMALLSTHFRKIITESNTGITLWISDGTTANGNLAATTGDICLNAGSNKPEYCTNGAGSVWAALV